MYLSVVAFSGWEVVGKGLALRPLLACLVGQRGRLLAAAALEVARGRERQRRLLGQRLSRRRGG